MQRQSFINRICGLMLSSAVLLPTAPLQAQALPEVLVGVPGKLIANGGFDIGDRARHPIEWSVQGNEAGVSIVNLQAYRSAGLASLEIQDAKGSHIDVSCRRITAVPAATYTLRANVKGKSGQPATLSIEFWSFDGKLLETRNTTPDFSDDWQALNVEAVAPDDAAHIIVHIATSDDTEGVSYWDEADLQIEPLPYDPHLGTARELFLDDVRIESAHHVGRVVHPATISPEPVLRADKPWENSAYIYGTAYLDGVYKMWYTAYNDIPPHYHMAYAESKDGINWTKPDLGIFEFEGSKKNNITDGSGTVAYNPYAPPERRYASMGFVQGVPNETMGYYVWFSADGLHWKRASEKPALLDGDVSVMTYDHHTKRYIASIKKRMFTARTPGIYERTAFVSTSTDAINWEKPHIAVSGDYADDGRAESLGGLEAQIYGMPVIPYESTYLGFPWLFYITNYTKGMHAGAGDGPVEVQIASSRDLIRWSRPVRTPVINPGLPGSWNVGAHYSASNILVDDKTVAMYYGAFNNEHGGGDVDDPDRGRNIAHTNKAVWRRDGWVSLTNGSVEGLGTPGVVVTKPLVFDGASLHVNVVVREKGELKVAVLDNDGNPIPGYEQEQAVPVQGDQLDATITWSSGKKLDGLTGQPVRLRFQITNADLYSYWITD